MSGPETTPVAEPVEPMNGASLPPPDTAANSDFPRPVTLERFLARVEWEVEQAEKQQQRAANEVRSGATTLDGLNSLARVATVGYDALVAETSDPIRWTWFGVISEANHVELSGPSFGGKTTLATLFVAALANPGEPIALFGREVTPIREGQFVVLIEEENGKHSMRKKLETACRVLNLPVKETLDRVITIVRKGVRVDTNVWWELVQLGQRGAIGALFIDSRARVLRNGESNSEEAQAAVADSLFFLIEQAKAPVFVISHTRKGQAEAIEDVSGSGQRGAGADVILLVNPTRDERGKVTSSKITFIKIRDDVEEHPDPVEFTLAKDPEGRWSLGSSLAKPESPLDGEVIALLRSAYPEPLSLSNLRKGVAAGRGGKPDSKCAPEPVLAALRKLIEHGFAVVAPIQKRDGTEFEGWRATEKLMEDGPTRVQAGSSSTQPPTLDNESHRVDATYPLYPPGKAARVGSPPLGGSTRYPTDEAERSEERERERAATAESDAAELYDIDPKDWKAHATQRGWSTNRRGNARALAKSRLDKARADAVSLNYAQARGEDARAWATERGWDDPRIRAAMRFVDPAPTASSTKPTERT